MIEIQECQIEGYPARTRQNIFESDVTIAIAQDFSSAGEKLTKKTCLQYGKLYIPIQYNDYIDILAIVEQLNLAFYNKPLIIINIAGNGIYNLPNNQEQINKEVFSILEKIVNHPDIIPSVKLIRSGGQSGIDEAGVIAADALGIKTLVLAPKGWHFRTKFADLADKDMFCARFNK